MCLPEIEDWRRRRTETKAGHPRAQKHGGKMVQAGWKRWGRSRESQGTIYRNVHVIKPRKRENTKRNLERQM